MVAGIYEPLDEENLDVRFLRLSPATRLDDYINCLVYKASVLDDTYPVYRALSYCWGSPTPACQITLNGVLVVGPNLDSALRHLRDKSTDIELWVDALCINQDDLDERASQVQLMDSMYGDAEEVVVWLGDSSNDSKIAISTIKKWSEWYELKGKADKDAAFSIAEDLPLAFKASAIEAVSNLLTIASLDYKKSTEEVYCEVYCEVAERLLLDDQSLRLVAIASGVSSCPTNITKLSLPSWVPDWTCGDSLERLNFDFVKSGDNLNDGADIGQFVRFSDDHHTLVAKGVIYDTIAKTYPPEWLTDMKAHKASILGYLLGEESSNRIPKFQGLFRALSLNMEWPKPGNAESRMSFLNKAGWYLWKFWLRDGEESSHNPTGVLLARNFFHGAAVVLFQEFEAMIRTGIRWKESDVQKDIVDFCEAATRRMRRRILFETEQRRIGLGPPDTQMGHKISTLVETRASS
ncbi:hypothetical protein SAPIO_CDS4227 [Scedosporium apiospermum]|uniref:Heterokaryon incompatibility domain-containing protein n=1 Tax=Pseudallescheria apiosperma TaxID=563466 RepID=A0A084G8G8_PSEDA|nr:uncharacterized protein SAPIO_CDS4227 [Scedosporium apiospermum]KEZ43630.1 hypothetical protein SAPIO_CDS4227 [Scedosporium apiospermum]